MTMNDETRGPVETATRADAYRPDPGGRRRLDRDRARGDGDLARLERMRKDARRSDPEPIGGVLLRRMRRDESGAR